MIMPCLANRSDLSSPFSCTGDIISQLFVEKTEFNAKRTLTFTALGLVFVGPTLFVWYGWLGKLVPGSGMGSIIASLALDQIAFAPAFIAAFMSVLTVIEVGRFGVTSNIIRILFFFISKYC